MAWGGQWQISSNLDHHYSTSEQRDSAPLGAQLQQEKGGVFLSLLKLCSRTLINEELLSFQIYGNLEKHIHMKSRGENTEFQRHVHLSLTYVNTRVSKFWTEPSLKTSSLSVTAGWNGGARLALLVAWGDEGSVTARPPSPQPCPQGARAPMDNRGVMDCKISRYCSQTSWQWRIAVQSLNDSLCFLPLPLDHCWLKA